MPIGLPPPRVMIFLSVCSGGGSLLLFAWFLLFGAPLPFVIVHSNGARLAWDALLCLLFFVQHSAMIRRSVKQRASGRVPSTYYPAVYSFASGLALFALVLLWQPTGDYPFHLHGAMRWVSACVAALAVAGFVWGVRSLRDFDPFGVRPLEAKLRGVSPPSSAFVARGPYRLVRHPLYLFMLLLIWSTPRLSTDQLLFNVLWTAWIVVGCRLEERDLLAEFGDSYKEFQQEVPMIIPSIVVRRAR